LVISTLHDDRENLPTQHTTTKTTNQTGKVDVDLLLVLQHTYREPKPSTKLKDSIEYSQQPFTYLADSNAEIPRTCQEAMKMPNLWLKPISKEIEILKARDIFKVVQRPKNKNVVGLKWVFAVKWNKNSKLDKRKARIVTKRFTQVIGEDYDETYASVA